MIGIASKVVDRLAVLHLQLLRIMNGRRAHVRCRGARGANPALRPESWGEGDLREAVNALPVPRLRLASWGRSGAITRWRFHFESPVPTGCAENDLARGTAWTHTEPGQTPAVVLLHGWMMSHFRSLHPLANAFFRKGLDVFFLELPHHMHRRRPGTYSGECFFGPQGEYGLQSLVQSILDTCSLVRWLRREGRGVGLYGVSLGGMIALSCACYSSDLHFVIASVPACSLEELAERSLLVRKLMSRADGGGNSPGEPFLRQLDPMYLKPLIPPRRVVLVVGRGDLIVPPALPLRLAERWNGIPVLLYPHGHITVNASRKMRRDLAALVDEFLPEMWPGGRGFQPPAEKAMGRPAA